MHGALPPEVFTVALNLYDEVDGFPSMAPIYNYKFAKRCRSSSLSVWCKVSSYVLYDWIGLVSEILYLHHCANSMLRRVFTSMSMITHTWKQCLKMQLSFPFIRPVSKLRPITVAILYQY